VRTERRRTRISRLSGQARRDTDRQSR
jgi:hypothetical protein